MQYNEIERNSLIAIVYLWQVIYIYTCGKINNTQSDHILCEDAFFWRLVSPDWLVLSCATTKE